MPNRGLPEKVQFKIIGAALAEDSRFKYPLKIRMSQRGFANELVCGSREKMLPVENRH